MTETVADAAHATFTIERVYPQAPARVFNAHADIGLKRRWFAEGEGFTLHHYALDFRVDGRETARFSFEGGPEVTMEMVHQVIVPDRLIVIAYRMAMGDQPISASLATIVFIANGGGTRLTYTEQGVYFAGGGDIQGREEGSRGLLERLAEVLAEGG
ncbi:SRPBCC family protein [Phenylobacterium sp.]|uniref:SRPBCC family protein n=1 Tax=Phenylobacterium sp. TaxID=1871053 RepID=UPI002732ACF9|nr:SRPBCC family protein [Phenylobacterium sp.]MDP3854949.1 SRPBCC family protein [Phenylobacterium sp.]